MSGWGEMVKYVIRDNTYKGFYCNFAGSGTVKFTDGEKTVISTQDPKETGEHDLDESWTVKAWIDCKKQINHMKA